mgnify:CR=1 FL=1
MAAALEALDMTRLADVPVRLLSTGQRRRANLARVLPQGVALEVERSAWAPQDVFRVLAGWGGFSLESVEGTWNLGLGQALVVDAASAADITAKLNALGVHTWQLGEINGAAANAAEQGYITNAKGVDGGAVRLVGAYAQ